MAGSGGKEQRGQDGHDHGWPSRPDGGWVGRPRLWRRVVVLLVLATAGVALVVVTGRAALRAIGTDEAAPGTAAPSGGPVEGPDGAGQQAGRPPAPGPTAPPMTDVTPASIAARLPTAWRIDLARSAGGLNYEGSSATALAGAQLRADTLLLGPDQTSLVVGFSCRFSGHGLPMSPPLLAAAAICVEAVVPVSAQPAAVSWLRAAGPDLTADAGSRGRDIGGYRITLARSADQFTVTVNASPS